jgi:hypothetical protein
VAVSRPHGRFVPLKTEGVVYSINAMVHTTRVPSIRCLDSLR